MVTVTNPFEKKSLTVSECAAVVQHAALFVSTHRGMFEIASHHQAFSPAYLHEKGKLSTAIDSLEASIGKVASSRTARDFGIAFNQLSESITRAVEARQGNSDRNIGTLLDEHRKYLNGGTLGAETKSAENLFWATHGTDDCAIKLSSFAKNRHNIETPKLDAREHSEFRQKVCSSPLVSEMAGKAAQSSQRRY